MLVICCIFLENPHDWNVSKVPTLKRFLKYGVHAGNNIYIYHIHINGARWSTIGSNRYSKFKPLVDHFDCGCSITPTCITKRLIEDTHPKKHSIK